MTLPIRAAVLAAPALTRIAAPPRLLETVPAAVALGCILALASTLGKAVAVWRTGMFFSPDDAMRAVEVRDFMAGQGWFDLVPHRLSPAHPFVLHWSRLIDLPLAAAIRSLELFANRDTAERLVRIAEPAGLYVAFLAALASLARDLAGRWGPLAACLLAAGAIETVSAFVPGHIHHHGAQVTLLLVMTKLLCDALDPARAGRAAGAGAAAALSLGVNLQNLPFVATACAALTLMWVVEGAAVGRALRGFALGLMGAGAVVFLLQVPPGRYGEATCDAFAAPHLLAAWAGGACLLALAGASPRLRRVSWRLAAAAAGGLATLALLKLTFPACLGDPYANVDPLLRERWLSEVGEAMPLTVLLRRDPAGTIPLALGLGAGLAATVAAAVGAHGLARRRWIAVAALNAVAVLGACWEVRVAASAEALSALGGAWVLCRLFSPEHRPNRYAALSCVCCGLALTQAGWAAVVPARLFEGRPLFRPDPAWPRVDARACFAPSSYDGLRGLPPGLVMSGIDVGSHILAYTAHGALAAPYHRNADGNRPALLALAAPPDVAERMIREAGARYLALCLSSPEMQEFAARDPNGLAGEILANRAPPWLAVAAPDAGPMRVYAVLPSHP